MITTSRILISANTIPQSRESGFRDRSLSILFDNLLPKYCGMTFTPEGGEPDEKVVFENYG